MPSFSGNGLPEYPSGALTPSLSRVQEFVTRFGPVRHPGVAKKHRREGEA